MSEMGWEGETHVCLLLFFKNLFVTKTVMFLCYHKMKCNHMGQNKGMRPKISRHVIQMMGIFLMSHGKQN